MGEVRTIALANIRENPVALRAVNRQDEGYLGLVESIKSKGFLGAITGRAKVDPETKAEFFELVDGLHRFCAAKDAGLTEINMDVVDLTDTQTWEAQIMTNIHKIETRPVEYSKGLLRLLAANPLMTETELAGSLGKSPQWIRERLGLVKIANKDIADLVNEGKIKLANAYALAKLPPEEMADFVDRAMTLPPDEFCPAANARMKELREAKRKGTDAGAAEFQAVAFMQKMKDVKDELDKGEIAQSLCAGLTTAQEGFAMAIKWMLHLDPRSTEVQKAKDDARKQQRDAAAQKRLVEAADKKAKKAQIAAEEAEKAKAALAGKTV